MKKKTKKYWKEKTRQQKIFLFVTIVFLILDSIIVTTNFARGRIIEFYFYLLGIESILKFSILSFLNKNHLEDNAIASTPYIGGIYAILKFFENSKIVKKIKKKTLNK